MNQPLQEPDECEPLKNALKDCLKSKGIIARLSGSCEELRRKVVECASAQVIFCLKFM